MAWGQPAGNGILNEINRLIADHYPELAEAEVRIGCRFLYGPKGEDGAPTTPAMKAGGREIMARWKIWSQPDRSENNPDATLEINGDRWSELDDEDQTSLLDGMLERLGVVRDKDGHIKSDDSGRPRLEKLPAELHFEGSTKVMKRYGKASRDSKNFLATAQMVQGVLDFDPQKWG